MIKPVAPVTATVARIARLAMDAGLNPYTRLGVHRGGLEMLLDARDGEDSAFGVVVIGARTGRVLRGFIQYGNEGRKVSFSDGRALVRELRSTVTH
uniref:hypothetical protein n=1 Tax=Pseudonocardia sp. CA-138482 TaxID=3240023 RepID=UPI003F497DB8